MTLINPLHSSEIDTVGSLITDEEIGTVTLNNSHAAIQLAGGEGG